MSQKDVGNKIPIYKLKTTEEVMKYYDEWGEENKYNKDMLEWNYTGPKESLLLFAPTWILYETLPSKNNSLEGPSSSYVATTPKPTFSLTGPSIAKTCEVGAPLIPTHWERCIPKMDRCPLEPAYPGFTVIVLYIYCVNCGSCCASN